MGCDTPHRNEVTESVTNLVYMIIKILLPVPLFKGKKHTCVSLTSHLVPAQLGGQVQ